MLPSSKTSLIRSCSAAPRSKRRPVSIDTPPLLGKPGGGFVVSAPHQTQRGWVSLDHARPVLAKPVLYERSQLWVSEASSGWVRMPRSGQFSFVPRGLCRLFQNRKRLGTRFCFVKQRVRCVCSNVPMFQESMNGLGRGRGYTQRHLIFS